jgi:hypothetical protein
MERGSGPADIELGFLVRRIVRWIMIVKTNGRTNSPSLIFIGLQCLVIALTICNCLLVLRILGTKSVVLLLETLGCSLKGDVPLDLALLVELYARLEFSKLRLLALSKGALCGPSGYTVLACRASRVPTEPGTCSGRADHWHRSSRLNPFEYSENKRDCKLLHRSAGQVLGPNPSSAYGQVWASKV